MNDSGEGCALLYHGCQPERKIAYSSARVLIGEPASTSPGPALASTRRREFGT
jgi:hypothetical protein